MIPPIYISTFDSYMTLLGAIGIYPVMNRLIQNPKPNPLEEKLKWISIFMFILFTIRYPLMAFDIGLFGGFTYMAAIGLVMSVFLYFETLLRRHMPLWLKIFMSAGLIIFVVLAVNSKLAGQKIHLIYFGIFVLSAQASVISISLFRNRKDYNRIENSLIDLSVLSLLFLAPFFLTDISSYGQRYLPKLGVIGGLIFAYTSMYNQSILQNRAFLLKKITTSLGFSLILTLAMSSLVQEQDGYFIYRTFTLFFAVNLIFRIYYAVNSLDGKDDFVKFVEKVNEADKSSVNRFLKSMHLFFEKVDKRRLSIDDLKNYDSHSIANLFEKNNTHLLSIYDVRESLVDETIRSGLAHEELETLEQIIDILEKFEMTYICKMGIKDPLFVLFHVPMISYTRMVFRQTLLISDTIKQIEGTSKKLEQLHIL